MKFKYIFWVFFLMMTFSCKVENARIERFVWIVHNRNWIWNPMDLKALYYIDFSDSSNKMRFATLKRKSISYDYYITFAPDSLRNLIVKNLYTRKFPDCFSFNNSLPNVYDGLDYCIIFKFNNQSEQIINYNPTTIPDSLRRFTEYLENLVNLNSYSMIDSFDRISLINKYRDNIIKCGPLAPPPVPEDKKIHYMTPIIEKK